MAEIAHIFDNSGQLPIMSHHNFLHTIYIGIFAILLSASFLLTDNSAMTGRNDNGKVVEDDGFKEFLFKGSVEPNIPLKQAGKLKYYQVLVFIKTVQMPKGVEWRGPEISPLTDHEFSIPLRFHRNDLQIWWKKAVTCLPWLPEHWHHPPNGIEQIKVEVRAKFEDGREMILTWLFVEPDFSLHYQLNVGVLEGKEYWLKAKIALPPGIQFHPADKINVIYIGRDEHVPSQFHVGGNEQFIDIDTYSYGELTVNEITRTRDSSSKIIEVNHHHHNGKFLRVAFKIFGPYVRRYSTDAKLIIKLVLQHDEFLRSCLMKKKASEKIAAKLKIIEKEGNDLEKDENRRVVEYSGVATKQSETSAEDVCSICLNEVEEGQLEWRSKSCGHSFHLDCILKWKHNYTCPLCRAIFTESKDVPKTFMFLFEDPVFSASADDKHYSFEYKYPMENDNDDNDDNEDEDIDYVQQKFLEEMGTDEQLEFLKTQHKWMPAKQELSNFLSRPEPHSDANSFWIRHAVLLAKSRLKTVKVTRLPTIKDENEKK